MSLPQRNFDRAVASGMPSLRTLAQQSVDLRATSTQQLRTLAWDLEAIEAALRMELNNRLAGPDSMDMA